MDFQKISLIAKPTFPSVANMQLGKPTNLYALKGHSL
jgi:hypothetical protein